MHLCDLCGDGFLTIHIYLCVFELVVFCTPLENCDCVGSIIMYYVMPKSIFKSISLTETHSLSPSLTHTHTTGVHLSSLLTDQMTCKVQ